MTLAETCLSCGLKRPRTVEFRRVEPESGATPTELGWRGAMSESVS
ncbi:unnamed protein product [Heligmosomoides polygyrus]|uniref:Uncharacterized protein n=1 Tax=Heligmosomoides polygyrus TaxID=6339 RepID=A0A3P8DFF9_HELPZ|nr:unnamed protein product [Heligmosomoides polygyrus]